MKIDLWQHFIAIAVIPLLLLPACATTAIGPKIASDEERRAQAILLAEAAEWQKSQEEKIHQIGARLRRAAESPLPLEFRFVARPEQTRGRINPDSVNAWTDGRSVWITRGMIRFLKNDDELAIVLAHEMAHAFRGHMKDRAAKQVLRLALGPGPGQLLMMLIDAATAGSDRDKEREADLYSLIWADKAGFNIDGAKELLKRMAIERPESVTQGFLSRHPTSAERLLAMEKISAALEAGLDPLAAFPPQAGRGARTS